MTERDVASEAAAGVVERYHDITFSSTVATAKDLQYLRSVSGTAWAIGLLLPTAAGAAGPGQLTADEHELHLGAWRTLDIRIPLIPDAEAAVGLTALFPPAAGAGWQALKPANYDWVKSIPTQTVTITNGGGQLHYFVDFGSASLCNGCTMQMTACATQPVPLPLRLMVEAMAGLRLVSDGAGLTCAEPKPSVVTVVEGPGNLLPNRPLNVAFGFWGGQVVTTTMTTTAVIPLRLEHTSTVSQTYRLEPIASELGFAYEWRNMANQPIGQITLPPATVSWGPLNLQARTAGLPTCARLLDTVHITATHVTTPSLQATNWVQVQLAPDPARCPLADIGVRKIASATEVNAGDWLTYTLTITNYENRIVSAVVTDTLEPAYALAEARLPAGCELRGGAIRCAVNDLPARGARSVQIGVRVAATFAGALVNLAYAEPAGAIDTREYDNIAVAPEVEVRRTRWPGYLPLVKK
jgi:uncharacterized repeat protein (TIGR01451 family)